MIALASSLERLLRPQPQLQVNRPDQHLSTIDTHTFTLENKKNSENSEMNGVDKRTLGRCSSKCLLEVFEVNSSFKLLIVCFGPEGIHQLYKKNAMNSRGKVNGKYNAARIGR
jgi:hypothetical protein